MNAFVDYAVKEHGVKRFVLIGGSSTELNGPNIGKVWQHFPDLNVESTARRGSMSVLHPERFVSDVSWPD